MLRPLSLRDLPLFNRYRNEGLYLHTAPNLIWGPGAVSAGAILSSISSLSGVHTSVLEEKGAARLFGQVVHHQGAPYAHLSFLAPIAPRSPNDWPALLDQLIAWVSSRGAHSIIAELEETGAVFEAIQDAGFSHYTHQHIWRFIRSSNTKTVGQHWRPAEARDSLAIKLLCASVVPGIMQQAESTPETRLSGMVHYEEGLLRGYVDVRRGPRGIWIQPFVHLEAKNFNQSFVQIAKALGPSEKRPLYICIRSYQEQIESLLSEMEAEQGPLQAVMVKRTDVHVNVQHRQAIIEPNGRRAEPSAPIRLPLQHAVFEMEMKEYD